MPWKLKRLGSVNEWIPEVDRWGRQYYRNAVFYLFIHILFTITNLVTWFNDFSSIKREDLFAITRITCEWQIYKQTIIT